MHRTERFDLGKSKIHTEGTSTLPKIQWVDLATMYDIAPSVLVTSPAAEAQFMYLTDNFNFVDRLHVADGTTAYIEGLRHYAPIGEKMYAVGGGRVIDVARLLAHDNGIHLTVIPTIISTDSPFVSSTGVRDNGCVRYESAKNADRVLLDWKLLRQSPKSLHVGGTVDVLSIYTALYDWKLANDRNMAQSDELFDSEVAKQAKSILEAMVAHQVDIKMMSQSGLRSIVHALIQEVELCNVYGNSRPEEGGEHFFAYAIEPRLPHATHGELVGLGILVTAYVQRQPWFTIQKFMDSVEMNYLPKGISAQVIDETLVSMRGYVEEHALRYSVWNENVFDGQDLQPLLSAIHV